MSCQFTPAEKVLINSLLDPAVGGRFSTTIWPYLFWVLLSALFLLLYFSGEEGNLGLLISAYIALLLPILHGMATIRRRYLNLSRIIRKYEDRLAGCEPPTEQPTKIS